MAQCASNITEENLSVYEYTSSSRTFVTIFVPILAIVGFVSNAAFIVVVYRVKFMRSITNIYLVNLAVADCSLLFAASTQYIGDYIVSPVYDLRFSFYTTFGCSVPNFLIYLCYYASLWTVTLVSVERYLAICHTFWHRIVSNTSRAFRMVVLVWGVSLLFASLAAPYTPVTLCAVSINDTSLVTVEVAYCQFSCDWCAGALFMTDVIQFLVALIVNVVMYGLIIYHLGRTPIATGVDPTQSNRAIQTRNTVAKMLIINGVIFFICLFPFSLVNMELIANRFGFKIFTKTCVDLLSWIGRVLLLVNSVTNPFVYNASNPRYRLAFRQAFLCTKFNDKSVSVKTTTQYSQDTKV